MRRSTTAFLASAALVLGAITAVPAAQAKSAPDGAGIKVWTAEVTREQIPLLLRAGADAHELSERPEGTSTAEVELFLSEDQAAALGRQGVDLSERRLPGKAEKRLDAASDEVFRPYSGPGGLREEIIATSEAHPALTKVVSIGRTVKGQDILAVKVGKNADRSRDGSKPAVLYASNQHAREWITPEMTRRLMHHYLDGYGKDARLTRIMDTTELWFVLSANPDGYDYTFESDSTRLWRKNLRDNNGDGVIAAGDGVDLNRNFAYKWGYDNEGSSPDPADETYRGPGPGSEPETKAFDAFQKRIGFQYGINYHSAAELLLYGVGWQVATDTPDDIAYRALAGTPGDSAIPGYHPQVSSELYTTNGEADGHAANVNGMMMFTPEMSTCQTISNLHPDDEWNAADCRSGFNFPDDEKLIEEEFAKNIPFALSVAETAKQPDRPVSSVGAQAPDFTPEAFTTSYARGGDQEVRVTARKSVRGKRLNYRINDGRTRTGKLGAWKGGERYGGSDNLWFDEYRAEVTGADAGDRVTVWFTGRTHGGGKATSEPFTYTVAERPRADVLVLADEGAPATNADAYTKALRANGERAVLWDVASGGAPDDLGVLGHFKTVLWYTGDHEPDGATLLEVRDYLNEGGELLRAGEFAGGVSTVGETRTDDFSQYYLGAYGRTSIDSPAGFTGLGALAGVTAPLAGADTDPLDAAGGYTVTSDTLPAGEFPEFTSAAAGDYSGSDNPYAPYEGAWMAAVQHRDNAWNRLTRTVDLTSVTAADTPELRFALSYDTEQDYDNVVIEAHTVGQDDWTTLPDAGGGTSSEVPAECGAGFYVDGHPFLEHYLTVGADGCLATGTTGSWNRFTGTSSWQPVSVDLGAYAGRRVELSVSYISDPGSGGRGVFADDTELVVGGAGSDGQGFETELAPWVAAGPPAGSPPVVGDWARAQELFHTSAAVTTRDTVLIGFGLEHIRGDEARAALIGRALRFL